MLVCVRFKCVSFWCFYNSFLYRFSLFPFCRLMQWAQRWFYRKVTKTITATAAATTAIAVAITTTWQREKTWELGKKNCDPSRLCMCVACGIQKKTYKIADSKMRMNFLGGLLKYVFLSIDSRANERKPERPSTKERKKLNRLARHFGTI